MSEFKNFSVFLHKLATFASIKVVYKKLNSHHHTEENEIAAITEKKTNTLEHEVTGAFTT